LVESLYIPRIAEVIKMIEINIFRPLPHVPKPIDKSETGGVRLKVKKEPSWPKIFPIY
jgi:hypothetical protein